MTGLRAWLVQRGTAVIMLVLLLSFLARLMQGSFKTYEAWREWINDPLVSIMVALFFGVLLLHAWVGLRDIILDYVRPASLRLFAHSLIVVVYSGIGFWVIRILLK